MFDLQNLPVSGGLVLACAAYAGASFFVTGPMIAERTIAKSDWAEICPAELNAEVATQKPPEPIVPRMDCVTAFGWMGHEFEQLCNGFGNPELKTPEQRMAEAQERALYEAKQRQLEQRAAQSPSRCACAANVALEDRTAWALYAGSARLITPAPVKNLDNTLVQALHTPHCTLKNPEG